ncbi:hypothetical protein M8R20_24805 [Pseudomonas sp. R2.Fl]|nr:hypothetical protein [Pseudomonas sp. R2.Fl]
MDISIEIRRLLIKAARELSARDGVAATRAHLIGAFGGLGSIIRQEFDRAMALGPEQLDDNGEPTPVLIPEELPAETQPSEGSEIVNEGEGAPEDNGEPTQALVSEETPAETQPGEGSDVAEEDGALANDVSKDAQAAASAEAKAPSAKKKDTSE